VQHSKLDCCGEPTDVAPTNPPDINICPPAYDSLCECISANNLCMETCDQLASSACADYAAELTEGDVESYCFDECLGACEGYPETNAGRIMCLRKQQKYLSEEEKRLRELLESQQQICEQATASITSCLAKTG